MSISLATLLPLLIVALVVICFACGFIFMMLGLFVVFHIFRTQRAPADTSNRINKIRLVWFVLTREELFADTFPWLKNDELDNLQAAGKQ